MLHRPAPGLSSSCIVILEENTGFFVKCHCSRFYCRWLKQLFAFLDNHDFLIATSFLFGPIKSNVVKFSHFTVSNPPSARNWHLVNCGLADCPPMWRDTHGTHCVCGHSIVWGWGTQADPAIKPRNVTIYWPQYVCLPESDSPLCFLMLAKYLQTLRRPALS